MTEPGEPRASPERGDGIRAFGIFSGAALLVASAYLLSALISAAPDVFRDPEGRFGVVRIGRFNAALGLVLAYLCASLWLGQRWARRDFATLRRVVETSEEEWSGWASRIRSPRLAPLARAVLAGVAFGVLVDSIGGRFSYVEPGTWRGHLVWLSLLNALLFAVMGALIALGSMRARVFQEVGRRVRVRLGEIAPLAPFARAGLRAALLWFLGTSLASLLLVDTDSPVLVLSILVATTGIAVASLLAPSRGVHERLREAKRDELAWLRDEIARSSEALRRGDAAGAAQLPALLAWEAHVAAAPEWPFDTSTWLRFALLLLVPLGSWLGGALAERVVDGWLG